MRAIILAAGRGSRMGPATEAKPKCLTRLCGKPLIDWQIEALQRAGISDILVVRGYCASRISGEFQTIDNPRWESSNMAASLMCADQWISKAPVVVSYSDIVYHPDHVAALTASNASITITADRHWLELWKLRFADPLADAETFSESFGRLTAIGGKPADPEQTKGQYMGLLKFTPQGWRAMVDIYSRQNPDTQARLDMTAWLHLALEQGQDIRTCPVDGRWCEVDSLYDLHRYESTIADCRSRNRTWRHDWRWA